MVLDDAAACEHRDRRQQRGTPRVYTAAMVIRPFAEGDGAMAASWTYPAPYDVYNDDIAVVDDPAFAATGDERYAVIEDGS